MCCESQCFVQIEYNKMLLNNATCSKAFYSCNCMNAYLGKDGRCVSYALFSYALDTVHFFMVGGRGLKWLYCGGDMCQRAVVGYSHH